MAENFFRKNPKTSLIKNRESTYVMIIKEPAKSRIANDQCPSCGKPRAEWTRRRDWRCCSEACTSEFENHCIIRNWATLRLSIFERDNYRCVKCGKEQPVGGFVADHIKPIAIGGKQWDSNNIQTLCKRCDKIKTAKDKTKIAELRQVDRIIRKGQLRFK